ncbi:MAG: DUF1566 domain-containing protein [Rhodospirillaceae bacterium]|nr:DUF1566 domain-containing protein [Rhodospirillaceae bacterium]
MSLRALLIGSVLVCSASAAYAECLFEPRIPTSRYVINGAQVFDKETKLTWQRCSLGQKWQEGAGCVGTPQDVSWAQAKKMDGTWRLPTKDELSSLVSDACLRSANAEAFPGFTLQHPTYWSSTETAPGLTWTVNLTSGHEFNALQTSSNNVLLVQGQQIASNAK